MVSDPKVFEIYPWKPNWIYEKRFAEEFSRKYVEPINEILKTAQASCFHFGYGFR